MAGDVYRLTEVVGTSKESVDGAVRTAVERASRTLQGLDWFEVKEVRGSIREGVIDEYQVLVKIGFKLMEADELRRADPASGSFDPD
jgi:flavin-binding protein dodecin